MTHPLMTKGDGSKFGKSVGGAVWLDPARTSPYQFRQFWVQSDDQMVATYLKMLSMRPLDEIEDLIAQQAAAPERRPAQRALAEEMTALVHGADGRGRRTRGCRRPVRWRPSGASLAALETVAAEVPHVDLPAQLEGVRVHELLVQSGVAKSNGEVSPTARARCRACRKSCARRGRPVERIRPAQRAVPAAPQGQPRLRGRKMFDARLTPPHLVDSVAIRLARRRSARETAPTAGFGSCVPPLRLRAFARSFGSLKTEEKTERQCGQRWNQPRPRSRVGPDAVLSIQKSPGSQPGAQIKKSDECYQHTFFPCDALSSQQVSCWRV